MINKNLRDILKKLPSSNHKVNGVWELSKKGSKYTLTLTEGENKYSVDNLLLLPPPLDENSLIGNALLLLAKLSPSTFKNMSLDSFKRKYRL